MLYFGFSSCSVYTYFWLACFHCLPHYFILSFAFILSSLTFFWGGILLSICCLFFLLFPFFLFIYFLLVSSLCTSTFFSFFDFLSIHLFICLPNIFPPLSTLFTHIFFAHTCSLCTSSSCNKSLVAWCHQQSTTSFTLSASYLSCMEPSARGEYVDTYPALTDHPLSNLLYSFPKTSVCGLLFPLWCSTLWLLAQTCWPESS